MGEETTGVSSRARDGAFADSGLSIAHYKSFLFDCDGVVLDSNPVKSEAFRAAAAPWGDAAAEALVAHHLANGGISRYEKFAHFLERILPEYAPDAIPGRDGPDLDALLAAYADAARSGLMACPVANGLEELRAATPKARWMIVSGGDQAELRDIFRARKLTDLFDGGIHGSPDTKKEILENLIDSGGIRTPALFLGDSRYDHEAADGAGLDFCFVSGWSEFSEWQAYTALCGLDVIRSVEELVSAEKLR